MTIDFSALLDFKGLTFSLAETVNLLIGTVIATAIGWLMGLLFGKKAAAELKKEAQKLQRLTSLLAQAMQQAKLANFTFDDDGVPTGIAIMVPLAKLELTPLVPEIISTAAAPPPTDA